ncbi:MAG: energy-coupling factor transporter transmembrane protein EcfT [Deltaproteobacteria bacterium]|jgi:energy-coupling factor transport system permease protein|nr:energy-coupling factor transporter transmembrane protein EcfT [Deltaproteobacteria bacterium]
MPVLSDKFQNLTTGRLDLTPETRLGLTFLASIFSLVMADSLSLGIILSASVIYLMLEIRLKVVLIVYLVFLGMATTAAFGLWLLGFWIEAMKNQPARLAVLPFVRVLISLNTVLPLALHTQLSSLTLTLNRIYVPGIIKLPFLIIVRFIPTFINDVQQLREAVAIRFCGHSGVVFWLRRPRLWWRVYFMPLVVRLIRSADELALAAELKGLSASTDFGTAPLVLGPVDKMVLVLSVTVITIATLVGKYKAGG